MSIFIHPPHMQFRQELAVKIGPTIPMAVVDGIHGPRGIGIHGAGVKTPNAAAVNAAVIGLAILIHTPNGFTFKNGIKSTHEPIGPVGVIIIESGKNVNGVGATPKLHFTNAPLPAANPGIIQPPYCLVNFHLYHMYRYNQLVSHFQK